MSQYPIRGEATAHYLYWSEKVAPRIRDTYDDADVRFIAILRDPVRRAYSAYWHKVRDGKEDLSFEDALSVENSRMRENWGTLQYSGLQPFSYFSGGRYASMIRPFLSLFSRESFHFLLLDDLVDDFDHAQGELLAFLGADLKYALKPVSSNVSATPRSRRLHLLLSRSGRWKEILKNFIPYSISYRLRKSLARQNLRPFAYPRMEASVERDLRARYADEIRDLEAILGRDLSAWLSS